MEDGTASLFAELVALSDTGADRGNRPLVPTGRPAGKNIRPRVFDDGVARPANRCDAFGTARAVVHVRPRSSETPPALSMRASAVEKSPGRHRITPTSRSQAADERFEIPAAGLQRTAVVFSNEMAVSVVGVRVVFMGALVFEERAPIIEKKLLGSREGVLLLQGQLLRSRDEVLFLRAKLLRS